MYKNYYSMQVEAFSSEMSPDCFYYSQKHKEAFYFITYNYNAKEPYVLIMGEYGTGKTTIMLKFVETLNKKNIHNYILLQIPNYSYKQILLKICEILSINCDYSNDSELIQDRIFNHIQIDEDFLSTNKKISIIADDVHEMDPQNLDKLRMLANFNIKGVFPFRLILFAHTRFNEMLLNPELQSLNQRIRRRFVLNPLDITDTKQYIFYRLYKSGAQGKPLINDDAIEYIYNISKGIPRLINAICDATLLLGAAHKIDDIGSELVKDAIKDCQGLLFELDFCTSEGAGQSCIDLPPAEMEHETDRQASQYNQPTQALAASLLERQFPIGQSIAKVELDDVVRSPEKNEMQKSFFSIALKILIYITIFGAGLLFAQFFNVFGV